MLFNYVGNQSTVSTQILSFIIVVSPTNDSLVESHNVGKYIVLK